jgi:hypothetical protein
VNENCIFVLSCRRGTGILVDTNILLMMVVGYLELICSDSKGGHGVSFSPIVIRYVALPESRRELILAA